jgi:hypothetical protein
MIISELSGGLGNQMFQYACGRSLAMKTNGSFYLDPRPLYNIDESIFIKRPFELNVFKARINFSSEFYKQIFFPSNHIGRRLFKKIFGFKVVAEQGFNYSNILENKCGNIYLKGYWQSEKYFEGISDVIRSDFAFMAKVNAETEAVSRQILESNSISIHVRRGDYVTSETAKAFHGFIGLQYYLDAIKIFAERFNDAKYYIFSDDSEWVKQYLLNNINDGTIVMHNKGADSWQDMYLMSLCKHNIIANSSFSWWGAWLNKNPEKVVIAPKNWFAKNEMNLQTIDLIPSKWIRI